MRTAVAASAVVGRSHHVTGTHGGHGTRGAVSQLHADRPAPGHDDLLTQRLRPKLEARVTTVKEAAEDDVRAGAVDTVRR